MHPEPVPEVQWLSVPGLPKQIGPGKEAVRLLAQLGKPDADGDIPAALDEVTEH